MAPTTPPPIHSVRRGSGRPLVLLHGLGGSWRSWDLVAPALLQHREVITPDLPGFGDSPPLGEEVSIADLADAVTAFLEREGLERADLVGTSVGARLVLELARRGVGGDVVALDPGGFWSRAELAWFSATLRPSVAALKVLRPLLPALAANAATRTALIAQFSVRPWALPADVVARELVGNATAPSEDAVLHALITGPRQRGASSTPGRVTIGWGRQDRICLPPQARRATTLFPTARLHWFERCGHFPQWDAPEETVELVLGATG